MAVNSLKKNDNFSFSFTKMKCLLKTTNSVASLHSLARLGKKANFGFFVW